MPSIALTKYINPQDEKEYPLTPSITLIQDKEYLYAVNRSEQFFSLRNETCVKFRGTQSNPESLLGAIFNAFAKDPEYAMNWQQIFPELKSPVYFISEVAVKTLDDAIKSPFGLDYKTCSTYSNFLTKFINVWYKIKEVFPKK